MIASRDRRHWGAARTAIWLGGAFAAGCFPSGRLVTRALTGLSLDQLGDGKPGSANVARSVGWRSGATVLGLDILKGAAPAALARLSGAGENTVTALAIAPVAAHIVVLKGRGAASGLGACFIIDPPTMAIGCGLLLGGFALHRNPQTVAVTMLALPVISLVLHRRPGPALRTALLIGILLAARIKGSPGAGLPATPGMWWSRFWLDRDQEGP